MTVTAPPVIAGDYLAGKALFGPPLDMMGVSGAFVLADDGVGAATDACEPLINGAAIAGNIAMVDRGTCNFTVKVKNAQNVGAIGAIVINNDGDDVITMGGDDPTIVIPSAFIGQGDGQTIRDELPGVSGSILLGDTFESPQAYCERPIPMGTSTSTATSILYSGTAGMKVRSLIDPSRKFILSNNHVLGAYEPTLCPDTAPQFTRAIQPSTGDLGFNPGADPEYVVGATVRTIPIDFTPGSVNVVDVALAITGPSLSSTTILGIGDPTPAVTMAMPGMAVTKSGRTTGVTEGTVDSIGATVDVNYGGGCGIARFVNQVVVSPDAFSTGGDSGSVILETATLNPVAHLFAGGGGTTIGSPMVAVYVLGRVFVDVPGPINSEADLMNAVRAADYGPEIKSLQAIQAREEAAIFQNAGVVGMGIGLDRSGQGHAFVIYVKELTAELSRALPHRLDGVPVRIRETGEIRALRPEPSTGHPAR